MKKIAFTLAEIMITIGIIGVVAAITIPLLMQNSNSKKFTTQFKKSLSTLNQAAIGAQAQYDLDYSLLTQINDDATCKSNTLAGGQYNFCGLFNNTLAGHTYLGKYGNVKGANLFSPYNADMKSFSVENFLFFSFADGAIVAFNPNAKGCGVGVGNVITTAMLSDKLANCIGFIDVNGTTPPNKEVQCAEVPTIIVANKTCRVTNGSMGDIFPVVFHDGAVEPATNASLAAFLGGNGKEEYELTEEEKLAKRRQFDKWEPQVITTPMSKADCEAKKEALGITVCLYDNDYWAAAAEKCGGVQNLPTDDDLYEFAKKIYPTCDDNTKECTGTPDFSQFPEGYTNGYMFSGSHDGSPYYRNTGNKGSYNTYLSAKSVSSWSSPLGLAVCVGDLEKQ
ncbi:type II secretion system protein [bacterium]|nr:type II secretion system protein [bacterium]